MLFCGEKEEGQGEGVVFFEAGNVEVWMGNAVQLVLPAVKRLEGLEGKLEEEQGSAAAPVPGLAGSQEEGMVTVIEATAFEERQQIRAASGRAEMLEEGG